MRILLPLTLAVIAQAYQGLDAHAQHVSRIKRVEDATTNKIEDPKYTCPKYQCGTETLPEDNCMRRDQPNDTYNLQLCTGNKVCVAGMFANKGYCYDPNPAESGGLPGDPCTVNDDCQGAYTTCENQICKGGVTGASCDDQDDCDVGYACQNVPTNAVCQKMIAVGGACGDYMTNNLCVNGAVCNNGICVEYFSQPNGAIVDTASAPSVCMSGYWEVAQERTDKSICRPAPRSPNLPMPIKCDIGTNCYSSDGLYSLPCACGFNSNGQGYCPIFPGDDLYQNYLKAVKAYATPANVSSCHYLDMGQRACNASEEVFAAVEETLRMAVMYPYLQDNDACVSAIFTS